MLASVSIIFLFVAAGAQKPSYSAHTGGNPVLWEPVNIRNQDLYYGPGGKEMEPDLSQITLIKEEFTGHSLKYRIRDGSGRKWVVKLGNEAQSETAAVRLLWALGYRTEINYLVPRLVIPGKGVFYNARLEARPDDVKRGDRWAWGKTPFEHTDQMQGLKLMMAFFYNWDMKQLNNVILKTDGEQQYVISDLGVAFGKSGPIKLPLFWRIGRTRNKPEDYARTNFVKNVDRYRLQIAYVGKNAHQMHDFTIGNARWLADLLDQLSDRQIRDAFRAANYSQNNIDLLTRSVKNRIDELDRASETSKIARRK